MKEQLHIRIRKNWLAVFSSLVFVVLLISLLNDKLVKEPHHIISSDITSYYTYLPAVFIYQDMELKFVDELPEGWPIKIWRYDTPTGKKGLKMTYGLSVLYLPFFLIAHLIASLSSIEANGYTAPYSISLLIASVVYASLGVYLIGKILMKYFKKEAVMVTLLLLVFGTNLFIYTNGLGAYSHSFSFFLFALFLHQVITFYEHGSLRSQLLIGISLGLIVLIRPTNGLIGIFFLLYGVFGINDLKCRLIHWMREWKALLLIAVMAFIIYLPQLIYWKFISGEFFHYSYTDEGFYFNDPKILKGLFGFRKGWLIYTPLMNFAILGTLLLLFNKELRKRFFWAFTIFIPLNIYVILSWWNWWYGGSFGHRSFIEGYALYAIPLCFIIDKGFDKRNLALFWTIVFAVFFLYLNLFQTWQYKNGMIHFQNMTKEAYWAVFGRIDRPDEYNCLLAEPDLDVAKFEGIDKEEGLCSREIVLKPHQLRIYKKEGTNFGDPDNTIIPEGSFVVVYYNKIVSGHGISVSLDENDTYKLYFYNNDEEMETVILSNDREDVHGLALYNHDFSPRLKEKGFDKVKIEVLEGDHLRAIGHLLLR